MGAEESFQQVSSVIAQQGPFDGLWAFSQVSKLVRSGNLVHLYDHMLARVLMLLAEAHVSKGAIKPE